MTAATSGGFQSRRVATPRRRDGIGRDEFLPPRRPSDTSLNVSAAKLGQVCYEHAHCRLWQENSHCDFLIPDLFGRCQCTAPMRRENDVCRLDDLVRPSPLFDPSSTTDVQSVAMEEEEKKEETGAAPFSTERSNAKAASNHCLSRFRSRTRLAEKYHRGTPDSAESRYRDQLDRLVNRQTLRDRREREQEQGTRGRKRRGRRRSRE